MSEYRFYDALRDKLTTEIIARTDEIGIGLAKDYAEYRERVGTVQGIREAMALAEELYKQMTGG